MVIMGETFSSETLNLSRSLMKEFKEHFGKRYSFETIGHLRNSDSNMRELNDGVIDIDIKVTYIPIKDEQSYKYSVKGAALGDDIEIEVEYVPNSFPEAYNDFIAELKETIRHELEHIAQHNNMGKEHYEAYPVDISFYRYLQLRHEIPAFVHGLYARSKTKKQTITESINDFFGEYKESFSNDIEPEIVRDVWMNWIQNNLKDALI
jgi:hypothetical protein